MEIKKIYIFALAATGQGISGSDRIFMEISRILSKDFRVEIFLWEEGFKMCQRQGLGTLNIKYQISNMEPWKHLGFTVNYFARIMEGLRIGLTLKIDNPKNIIIYSASEFWMDSLPVFILKKRYRQVKWVAAWFQTAPNPVKGFSEEVGQERYRIRTFLYWLTQLLIKPLIQKEANLILVNNQSEVREFGKLKDSQKVMVFLGALNLEKIRQFKQKYKNLKKKYRAVFQGRFHPQKGVVELIDIWKRVVDKKPQAMLAMIGDGPLMGDVKNRIKQLNLEKNINLFGYLFDGPIKYKLFAQSLIVLHPSLYDSGGMAAAEAMAFGLPAVGFNLRAYQSYYPQGMVKAETGNLNEFADKIIELLDDEKRYGEVAREAQDMVQRNWSFKTRVKQLLKEINQL